VRFFIRLSFDGTDFHGWQIQDNAPSLQQQLADCLGMILQTEISLTGCGRTDAGVHAKEFYAHFDLDQPMGLEVSHIIHKLNGMLPPTIAVQTIFEVRNDAHARFDARSRSYQYVITRAKDPFRPKQSYHLNSPLDLDEMNKACRLLLGEQDFASFCKANSDNFTTLCTVTKAEWVATDDHLIFNISANRFLRNMVRAIVGTMLDIGSGKMQAKELSAIILSKNRSNAGRSVPAQGLYLTKVEYPTSIFEKQK
jgi:tRNA pseudouridine38-40 synthase